jgi:hypothetical protein
MESRFSTQFAPGPASKGSLLDHHEQQGHLVCQVALVALADPSNLKS